MGMTFNIPDKVLHEICRFAEKSGIHKIILFGSRARNQYHDRSDIDIAVIGGDFDAFYWDVKENTHSLLSFDVVDYHNRASEELKHEIERDGITIYEKAG